MPDDRPSPWSAPPPTGVPSGWPPVPSSPLYAPAYPGSYGSSSAAPSPVPPFEVRVAAAPRPGRGLAITGVVLGGLALLGVGLMGLFVLCFALVGLADDTVGAGYGPLRGTLAPAPGAGLAGPALADEVSQRIVDDGGEPEGVTCPGTTTVAQGVTTVCHGSDYGEDSAFVVFFEDDRGSYTLLEI